MTTVDFPGPHHSKWVDRPDGGGGGTGRPVRALVAELGADHMLDSRSGNLVAELSELSELAGAGVSTSCSIRFTAGFPRITLWWSNTSRPRTESAMTVLITGAAGLVGHSVRQLLEARSVPVVPVDREACSEDGAEQVACDVTDRASVTALFGRYPIEAVVHCGGVSGPMVSVDDPRMIVDVNVGGTANLLDAARRAGVSRFVYCSSIAAYGRTPPGPVPESAPLRPLDVYGATKASGEHLVSAYRAQHGVPGVSLRLSTVFGPRRRTDCLIRTLLLDAVAGRPTSVPVAADAPQQYVHVDDVAGAVVSALEAPHLGDAYNITGGTLLTVEEVIEVVRRVDPRVRAAPAPADPVDAAHWPGRLDIGAAARDLGFRPDGDLGTKVASYRSWLRRNPSF